MRTRETLLAVRPDPGRPAPAVPDLHAGRVGLGHLRRGARTAAPRRPQPAARGADDDPGGVGEPRRRWIRTAARSTSSTPSLMEAWDGPACVSFTDGTVIGAVLDRNGLRPGRWWQTSDGLVVLGSESGVLDLDPADRGRQGPAAAGPDVPRRHRARRDPLRRRRQGRARRRAPVRRVAARRADPARGPAAARARRVHPRVGHPAPADLRLHRGGAAHPARADGDRAASSRSARWAPTPRSPRCRKRPRLLFDYFTELFAQVTNPPLDAIREEMVTSLAGAIGPEQNLLAPGPASCRQIVIPRPVIDNDELAKIWHVNADGDMPGFDCQLIDGRFRVHGGGEALAAAIERVRRECSQADRRRRAHPDPVRPRLRRRPRADSRAAAHLGGAPAPRPHRPAHQGRAWSSRPARRARCTTSRC